MLLAAQNLLPNVMELRLLQFREARRESRLPTAE
jgi:hypothetical protein